MEPAPLEPANERYRAFNRQLAALAAAGAPLDLGPATHDPQAAIERFDAKIGLRVSLGQSLEEAINAEDELPENYRCAALALLAGAESQACLDAVTAPPETEHRVRRSMVRSLVTPVVVGGLAYLATMWLCLYSTPTFEGVYQQLGETPSFGVRLLAGLRDWLPVWGPLVPLLFLLSVWMGWRADWRRTLGWTPAVRRFLAASRRAELAQQLANLSERRLPLDKAYALASELRLPGAPSDSSQQLALGKLPPLLAWSLADQTDPDRLTENLRFTAETYRHAAVRTASYWRYAGPAVVGGLVGGAILLAYGYALFWPFAKLLEDLAKVAPYPGQ